MLVDKLLQLALLMLFERLAAREAQAARLPIRPERLCKAHYSAPSCVRQIFAWPRV